MYPFISFYGQIIFRYSFITQFLIHFVCWWTFGLFLLFGYCEWSVCDRLCKVFKILVIYPRTSKQEQLCLMGRTCSSFIFTLARSCQIVFQYATILHSISNVWVPPQPPPPSLNSVLYPLSHTSSPFCFSYFQRGSCVFLHVASLKP
jgi:hypothetical protein